MIFQRRFHSHTPTTIDTPPTPPPKDGVYRPKTLEEILAIAVSPRAPKPPPHAAGTVASNPRIAKEIPLRSASSPLKSNVPRRAPSSRKTGHATIRTDAVGGHAAFESDAFAIHMPTTRLPIINAPASRLKPSLPNNAQAEAIETYKEKAKEARERNNNIGVRIPPNIASYDYAYASTPQPATVAPTVLQPSHSPPAPAGAFPVSPPAPQARWSPQGPRSEPVVAKTKIASNTSVYRKPTVTGVTTAAAVIEETVHFVRADANGGASRPTTPPKSTTVKISMKPTTPSPSKTAAVPAIAVQVHEGESSKSRTAEQRRGMYYRTPHIETTPPSRSPSPTKTMPNFTRQYSIEGDSIFGYKVKDPFCTLSGADKSASNSSSSEDEKPKVTTLKAQDSIKSTQQKRALTDRWPWIRKGATVGKPPSAPAPDPPIRAPITKRPRSIYVSPFEGLISPPVTPPALCPSSKPATVKKTHVDSRSNSAATPPATTSFDKGLQQIQDCFLLALKIGLALYAVVALWFVLDAIREALCGVFVPLQYIFMFVWAVLSSTGRGLGVVAGTLGGKIRVLRR